MRYLRSGSPTPGAQKQSAPVMRVSHWSWQTGAVILALLASATTLVLPPTTAASISPQWVRPARLASSAIPQGSANLGVVPADAPVTVEVVLAPSHRELLTKTLADLYDPHSAAYHRWLRPPQFSRAFGPSRSTIDGVETWMRSRGLEPSGSGFTITARSTYSRVSSLLDTPMRRYRVKGQLEYSAIEAPRVPASLAPMILAVLGISSTPVLSPRLHQVARSRVVASSAVKAHATAPTACADASNFATTNHGYTTDTIGDAYGIGGLVESGLEGTGETIALFELAAHSPSDVAAFASCFGLNTNVETIPVLGGGSSQPALGVSEANLDIEQVETQAPGATVESYEAPNTAIGVYDEWKKIVNDDTASVVSTSWGLCETESESGMDAIADLDPLFQQAAAQGQTIVASSGDSGSEDCWKPTQSTATQLAVDYPASDPWVTGIGGTTLSATSSTTWSETTWNDCLDATGIACAVSGNGAGGGGLSSDFAEPAWQESLDTVTWPSLSSPCGLHCRGVPDLAANAGTPEVFYDAGSWTLFIGTSIAAPLVAALAADIEQGCASAIGDLAPALYAYGAEGVFGYGLNDITTGDNDLTRTWAGADYAASAGWDPATGLGTPIAAGLSCPSISSVQPSSGAAGDEVTVVGSNLLHAVVSFGSIDAHVVSATQRQAVVIVPSGSGSVLVTASTPIGKGTPETGFTYASPPEVTTTTQPAPTAQTPPRTTPPSTTVPTSTPTTTLAEAPSGATSTLGDATPKMVVLSSVASPRGSTLSVDLSCLDAVCQGFAELVQHSVVAVRRGTDTVHQDRSIDLGSGSFRLLANHRGATGIHLNARGKRTLKAAEKHPVELSLVVSYSGQTVRRTIRVS